MPSVSLSGGVRGLRGGFSVAQRRCGRGSGRGGRDVVVFGGLLLLRLRDLGLLSSGRAWGCSLLGALLPSPNTGLRFLPDDAA